MSDNKWDRRVYNDFAVLYAPPPATSTVASGDSASSAAKAKSDAPEECLPSIATSFLLDRQLFCVHTDLDIVDAEDVADLKLALTNRKGFHGLVPNFLNQWRDPIDDRPLLGLSFLATEITARRIKRTRVWRFAVVPPSVPSELTALEIQLIVNIADVVAAGDVAQVYQGLKSTNPNTFSAALTILKTGLHGRPQYPGAEGFLQVVFP